MKHFLDAVAQAFVQHYGSSLQRLCFVFPNIRAGKFFLRSLRKASGNARMLSPDIITMGQLVATLASRPVVDGFDAIFTLFGCYRDLQPAGAHEVEFENFQYWGESILRDFDQVDMNLVDVNSLFKNVKNFREIASSYLTAEQKEIVERYWPRHATELNASFAADHDDFWAHFKPDGHGGERKAERKFMRLWEVLGPLYHSFLQAVAMKPGNPTTGGHLYRLAVDRLKAEGGGAVDPNWDTLVFVGFNSLSISELKIMDMLNAMRRADFYWDLPSIPSDANSAARYVHSYARRLKSSLIIPPTPAHIPEVTLLAVPSSLGQAKVAGRQIQTWIADGSIPNPANALNTAVVLPDPTLFTPMVQAIPTAIEAFNVTMGVPVKLTAPAALMSLAVTLHHNATLSQGRVQYYADDIKNLLSAPLVRQIGGDDADLLLSRLAARRQFRVDADELTAGLPALATLFKPVKLMRGFRDVADYISAVLDIIASSPNEVEQPADLNVLFTEAYRATLQALADALESAGSLIREIEGPTVLAMLERAMSTRTVPFVGEPLQGLQLMGVLETRALDFDNLIILSLNDGVLPTASINRSLIPDMLRRSAGLPTREADEASQAYIFYRLVMSARKVLLCYDSRQSGVTRNPGMSRFVHQLTYAPAGKLHLRHGQAVYPSLKSSSEQIVVRKTPRIMDKINQMRYGGPKNLSASALSTYIACPLKFYLQYVEGLDVDTDATDYMNSSAYGTIVHEVLEVLYPSLARGRLLKPGISSGLLPAGVTPDMLLHAADHPAEMIRPAILQAFGNIYPAAFLRTGELEPTVAIQAKFIERQVCRLISCEAREVGPLTILGAESKGVVPYEVIPGELTVNIKLVIDRVDQVDGKLRLVDYKTGSDQLEFSGVNALFIPKDDGNWPHAVMQLFLYSLLYGQQHPEVAQICPVIYRLRTVSLQGIRPIRDTSVSQDVADFMPYANEFRSHLNYVITDIFQPDVPFTPTKVRACTFCNFKSICGKEN